MRSLRLKIPALFQQANTAPALAGVIHRQLLRVFAASLDEEPSESRTANATASVEHWRGRELFPTEFGSADLRALSSELHLRSIFSARTTNADYLAEVQQVIDQILSGEINMATGRWHLMKKLKQLGYDPEKGFPQDMADVPPAERGSLQDLSSEQRIDLMLKTNVAQARNYARVVEGNTEFARYAFPAWELKRLESRTLHRGERKVDGKIVPDPHNSWQARWGAAGESVAWEGALASPMMARKDSPIWAALGEGVGGYADSLGHPFPPFAFNSGMDWRAVPREEWETLGHSKVETGPMQATLAPTKNEVNEVLDRLGPEFEAALMKGLEDLAA